MSFDTKSPGNDLVDPADYANRLADLETDRDGPEIEHLESLLFHCLRLGGAITYLDDNDDHVIENRDGVRPFPVGTYLPKPPANAESEIQELAFLNGVHLDKSPLDDWCDAVSANAGDYVQSDEVEQLIVGLRRLGDCQIVGGR